MNRIISIAIIVFAFGLIAFVNAENFSSICISIKFDQFVMFDEYQNLTIDGEKARLDNLFSSITNNKNLKGLIILKLNKSELRKKKIRRLEEIAKHFDSKKIDKTKFTFAILDNEKEQTAFYVEPQDVNLEVLLTGEVKNYKIIKAGDFKQKINGLFPKNKKI